MSAAATLSGGPSSHSLKSVSMNRPALVHTAPALHPAGIRPRLIAIALPLAAASLTLFVATVLETRATNLAPYLPASAATLPAAAMCPFLSEQDLESREIACL